MSVRPLRSASRLVALSGIAALLGVTGCGVSSAADTDPPIRNGKRVNDGAVADLRGVDEPATPRPRVLVVGDPRMANVGRSVVEREAELAISARSRITDGCAFLRSERIRLADGTVTEAAAPCADVSDWIPATVRDFDPDLALVLLSEPDGAAREIAGVWLAPCERVFDDWYAARLREAIDLLAGEGARVAIVPAHGARSVNRCLADAATRASAGAGATVVPDDPSTQHLVDDALRATGLVGT